jgi:type 2 lantibiotic biosynthesis protein LanM
VDAALPLPPWALTVQEIVARTSDGVRGSDGAPPPCIEGDPIPFEHLLEPAVRVARAELHARSADASRTGRDLLPLLSETAQRTLERALLGRLAALAAQPLYVEFSADRPYGMMLLGMLDEHAGDVAGADEYARFVARTADDGLLEFFRKYPVVARLVGTAVDQWVDATAEFLERLDADREEIERCLFDGSAHDAAPDPAGIVVTDVETSLSDPHRGGRAVAVLTLSDGRKLVYKPRSVALEVAFNGLVAWCNDSGCSEKLLVVRVLDRGDYGWMEYVDHAPCDDLDAARRYYRRAGMLLCLLHALRATDCHHANVIASGEHPVLVDAETLLHPEAHPIGEQNDFADLDPLARDFQHSVLRTLFLPAWHVSGDGQIAYDISALGGGGLDRLPVKVPDWRGVNTDAMVLCYRIANIPPEKNVVRIGEQALEATDFEPEILTGFEEMWRELVQRRDALLAEGSPLTAMRELPMRFLFRATRIYLSVLMNALAPEHLDSGARFSIELDLVCRPFLTTASKPAVWPILGAELAAMGDLDVPYFAGRTDSEALEIGDGTTLPHYLRRSGYADVAERISRLDDADARWQLALIKGSFQARVARNVRVVGGVHDPAPAQPLETAEMRAEAERLALELDRRSISDLRNEINWLGLAVVAETERVQLQPLGDALYEGRCGVALFLAALHRTTGASRPRELADRALASVRRLGDAIAARPSASAGFSNGPGPAEVGSMIYALVKIGELLGDEEPLRHARVLAGGMTADAVAGDRAFDVLAGSAGAILGLVSLHRSTDDTAALDAARAFGLHLLKHRVSHAGAPRAWRTISARPLTGFSHGAAGIAYALLRLYAVDGDDRFRSAASEAIEYERSVFSPAKANWPDLRGVDDGDAGAFPDQWCHGAAGIALARLGSRAVTPDPSLDADVEVGLATTQRAGLKEVDHACCGNVGRIEALWVGAHRMKRSDWRDAALAYASQMRARASRSGTYQLFPNLPCDVFNPGFYRGVAGIGYQWLRLADPELPSVLLWE